MSRDKQINEIAKVLNECCNNYDKNGNLLGNKCWACPYWCDTNHICCSYNTKEATALYNAGYRKSTDLAEEILAEVEKALDNSVETEHFKGSWFNLNKFMQRLAELKKKYTEGEK